MRFAGIALVLLFSQATACESSSPGVSDESLANIEDGLRSRLSQDTEAAKDADAFRADIRRLQARLDAKGDLVAATDPVNILGRMKSARTDASLMAHKIPWGNAFALNGAGGTGRAVSALAAIARVEPAMVLERADLGSSAWSAMLTIRPPPEWNLFSEEEMKPIPAGPFCFGPCRMHRAQLTEMQVTIANLESRLGGEARRRDDLEQKLWDLENEGDRLETSVPMLRKLFDGPFPVFRSGIVVSRGSTAVWVRGTWSKGRSVLDVSADPRFQISASDEVGATLVFDPFQAGPIASR